MRHHPPALRPIALAAVLACSTSATLAQTSEPITALPSVTVTGTLPTRLDAVPGSSAVISTKQLEAERPYSIREALQGVPGLHVVGEDAFGLNLNIGLRGLDPRRTSRTLLLEDGMPIHLAPYSDPSAHYHTPLERLQRVEVIKGSGQIVHGPQTVGGVINFVTRPVPREFTGDVDFSIGTRAFRRANASVGSGGEWGGWLLQATQRDGAGSRDGSRHRIRDVSVKGELDLNEQHSVRVKLGLYDEDSNFGEAGLDQARFDANPYANPFQNDKFELERVAAQAVHQFTLSDKARVSTQVYLQKTDRASYRQLDAIAEFEGVEEDNGVLVAELESETLRSLAPDDGIPNAACQINGEDIDYSVPNGFETYASACGNQMRPRSFEIMGIEPRLQLEHQAFGLRNEMVAGVRLHKERISRKRYNGSFPTAREDSPSTYFRDQNDIDTDAVAAYVQNTFYTGSWSITPGLRYESYRQRNTAVLAREDRDVNNGRSVTIRNSEFLPGLGVTYLGLPGTTVFAGIHRGIAPPRPDANLSPTDDAFQPVDPEVSTNIEVGLRSAPMKGVQVEAALFQIDFKNQIVPGYAVGVGQTFANAGSTLNRGLELGARVDFGALQGMPHNPYLTASYTNTFTAKFDSDLLVPAFAPGDDETTVFLNARGNRLPYAPKSTLSASVGFEHASGWDARVGITHIGKQYSDALNTEAADPNGQSGSIPAYTTFNASVNYHLKAQGATLYLSATNLADKAYLVSRVNGAFAGAPRQVHAGVRVRF